MRVFVYGTLMRNCANHHVMENAGGTFLRPVVTKPHYDLVDLFGFPGMIEGEYRVAGELFNVEDIAPIDRLEGHPHFYTRTDLDGEIVLGTDFPNDMEEIYGAYGYIFNNPENMQPVVGRNVSLDETTNVKSWIGG